MDVALNKYGYYEVKNKPSEGELGKYYEEKYYQDLKGHYEKEYNEDELLYFENEARLAQATLKKYGVSVVSLLDLGCGEGFFANYFLKSGASLKLVDFSDFGLNSQNPHLLKFFEKSSIDDFLRSAVNSKDNFDLINLDNVLEHVIDPISLLNMLKNIMDENTILRIEVPNDFSPMQADLLKRELTTETWVTIPEHLSYFGVNSLQNLVNDKGFNIISTQMNFPVEIFLYNRNSNYSVDKTLGKSAHFARLNIFNHLVEINLNGLIEYAEASSLLQLGRTIVLYVRKA